MRESAGESWTLQIVAAFILLFVAFLTLIISYSKCFKTKNEVISIIEKYEGLTDSSKDIINNYMNYSNYKGAGNCPVDYTGFEAVGSRYRYCVKPVLVKESTLVYYEVVMFYTFNIPVFGNIATFQVKGQTNDLSTKSYYDNISEFI